MHTIFDMIAGTSTGSIISGMISTPSKDKVDTPAYSAIDVVELYSTQGSKLFLSTAFPTWGSAIIAVLGMIILGYMFFNIGLSYFDNKQRYNDLKKARKRLYAMKAVKLEGEALGNEALVDADGDGIPDVMQLINDSDDDSSDDEGSTKLCSEIKAFCCCGTEKYIDEKFDRKAAKRLTINKLKEEKLNDFKRADPIVQEGILKEVKMKRT